MPLVRRPGAAAARLAAAPFLSLHPSPAFPVLSRSRPGLREAAPGPPRAGGGSPTSPDPIWRPPPPPPTRAHTPSPRPAPARAQPARRGPVLRPRRAEPRPWAGGGGGRGRLHHPEGRVGTPRLPRLRQPQRGMQGYGRTSEAAAAAAAGADGLEAGGPGRGLGTAPPPRSCSRFLEASGSYGSRSGASSWSSEAPPDWRVC